MSNFDSSALSCDPAYFPVKIGHREERGEEINPWFWYIWRAQQLKFFRTSSYFFRSWLSSGQSGRSKLDQKCLVLVRRFSIKTQILQKIFKQTFCLLEYYLWWEFRLYWTIFGGVRTQTYPKKGHWELNLHAKLWKFLT